MRKLLGVGLLSGVVLAAACGEDGQNGPGNVGAGGSPAAGEAGEAGSIADAGHSAGGMGPVADAGAGGVATTPGGAGGAGGVGSVEHVGGGGADNAGGVGGSSDGPVRGDVSGRVVFTLEGVPDVAVVIDGVVTSTDANGYFSVPNVAPTYQAILISSTKKIAQVMDGLTTRELEVQFSSGLTPREASVAGKLSGGAGIPNPAKHQTEVDFICDDCNARAFAYSDNGTAYSMTANWGEPAAAAGTLFALQWKSDASGPLDFTGFASKPFTLSDGGTFGNVNGSVVATNLAMAAVTERALSGDISLPAGLGLSASVVVLGPYRIPFDATDTAYATIVPTGLTLPPRVSINSSGTGVASGMVAAVPASGNLDFTLAAPPKSTLPVAAATGVKYSTTFSWTSPGGAMVDYVWFTIGGWTIYRYSTTHSTTLPDLSAYGVTLTPGTTGEWFVNSEGPATSVDDAVALENVLYRRAWEADLVRTSQGASRDFTFSN